MIFAGRLLSLIEIEIDILHRSGICHKTADALFRLQSSDGCRNYFDDDTRIQGIEHYVNEPRLVNPGANVYFEWGRNYCFEALPMSQKDCKIPSVVEFGEAPGADSLCAPQERTIGQPKTQLYTEENGIILSQWHIDNIVWKPVALILAREVLFMGYGLVFARHLRGNRMHDTMPRVLLTSHD